MSDIRRLESLITDVAAGALVPYLGAGALFDVADPAGAPMPADSDSLILAMNGGRPMAPKLMYEFPRAAMNIELKKGRSSVTRFLTELYSRPDWSVGAIHRWIAEIAPPYVIDVNRDATLQRLYADRPHILIQGVSRIGGTEFRFKIFQSDGASYREVAQEEADTSLPILFKPCGCPQPEPNYVASDADFVDYITELMGGFAIPSFVKAARKGRRYLFIGLPMTRDTERMVLSDMVYAAAEPAGYALLPEPTEKEERFCARQGIEILRVGAADLAAALGGGAAPKEAALAGGSA
ncbi:MAG: SIR2 family protein [Pseudomonadota bacterium]